jgi:hypothetical protein
MVKGEPKAKGRLVDLNSPENVESHKKFKAMADAHDEKIAEVAKFFDPVALMARANQVHEVRHPQLGIIKFGELMLSDSETVSKCRTKDDRSAMAVYLMLKKAYPEMPEYTPETIGGFYRAFPMVEGTSLLQFFLSQPCFLGEKSTNGSNQTQAPTS